MKKFLEKLKNVFKNKKISTVIFASLFSIISLGTGIGVVIYNICQAGGGVSQVEPDFSGTTGYDYIDEIWFDGGFNSRNLLKLVQYTSGVNITTLTNSSLSSVTSKLSSGNITATNMRSYTTGGKKSGNDIVVAFGGLDWTPTYLSKRTNGDLILTLWLANSSQLSGKRHFDGYVFSSDGTSTWNSGVSASSNPTSNYPNNMYSTSYIRACVLNNGGNYLNVYGATTPVSVEKSWDSVFAPFTLGDIMPFLAWPDDVSWQQSGQSAKTQVGLAYNSPNECLTNPSSGWYSSSYNYGSKSAYAEWAYDTLWLPSLTETGYSDSRTGMWGLSNNQRANTTYTWLRSGFISQANQAYNLTPPGYSMSNAQLSEYYGVRPALHLDISLAISYLSSIYSLTIKYDNSTTSCSTNPNVIISANGPYKTISRGGTFTFDFAQSSFYPDSIIITAIVVPNGSDYFVSFNSRPTTDSDVNGTAYEWTGGDVDLTLYVYQRYKITFEKGLANSGYPPGPMYKVHGTAVTLPTNGLEHTGFKGNGWNLSSNGSSTHYNAGASFTTNANTTLYTDWTADLVNVSVNMQTLDKSGQITSVQGGEITATQWTTYQNVAQNGMASSSSYTSLRNCAIEINASVKKGYVFLGFTTDSSLPTNSSSPSSTTYTLTPKGKQNDYVVNVYFRQVSDNRLIWTSEEGGYWYFEDGEYPQSEVTDSSIVSGLNNMSTSTSAEYSISYHDGKDVVEIPIYLYSGDGQKYSCATVNGVIKWFKVEPIRWRVSDYGTPENIYPTGKEDMYQPSLEGYGETSLGWAVSDKILFASVMETSRIDDSKKTDSDDFWLNNYVLNADFKFTYNDVHGNYHEYFGSAGSQTMIGSDVDAAYGAVVYTSNLYESKLTDKRAKLTAFASYLLYGTTVYANTYNDYWTKDLKIDGNNNEQCQYGCGVVVTSYGKKTLQWLNTMCGVRLGYMCKEVSRY